VLPCETPQDDIDRPFASHRNPHDTRKRVIGVASPHIDFNTSGAERCPRLQVEHTVIQRQKVEIQR